MCLSFCRRSCKSAKKHRVISSSLIKRCPGCSCSAFAFGAASKYHFEVAACTSERRCSFDDFCLCSTILALKKISQTFGKKNNDGMCISYSYIHSVFLSSLFLSFSRSLCLSVCLFFCLSIYLFVYLSVCLSVYRSVYLSI